MHQLGEVEFFHTTNLANSIGQSRVGSDCAGQIDLEPRPSGDVSKILTTGELGMAVNKPTGDDARKGAVRKRSQTKTKIGGATGWTKRDKKSGEFMAVKKPVKKTKAAKKFKGVRVERKAKTARR